MNHILPLPSNQSTPTPTSLDFLCSSDSHHHVTPDAPDNIAHAKEYLRTAAQAFEGLYGDARIQRTAMSVQNLGISELTAVDLMLRIYNIRCFPPREADVLQSLIREAYKKGGITVNLNADSQDRPIESVTSDTFVVSALHPRSFSQVVDNLKLNCESPYNTTAKAISEALRDMAHEAIFLGCSGRDFEFVRSAFSMAVGTWPEDRRPTEKAVVNAARLFLRRRANA